MFSPGKKKRVLPIWMTSPEKKDRGSEKKSSDKQKSIKNFFRPQENIVNKSFETDAFDFDDNGSESDMITGEDKSTVFIMSPSELEEVARLVLEQN